MTQNKLEGTGQSRPFLIRYLPQCRLNTWAHWAIARESHENRDPC